MDKINVVAKYVAQPERNKIIFCQDCLAGISFINVGHELAEALKDGINNVNTFELVKKIIDKPCTGDKIGKYIAIENINILFEPGLSLDVRSIFESFSRNQCLIIKTEMKIVNDKLKFPNHQNGPQADLQYLSYMQI